jgi:hypothetical protein
MQETVRYIPHCLLHLSLPHLVDEHSHDLQMSLLTRHVQWGSSIIVCYIDGGPTVDQQACHISIIGQSNMRYTEGYIPHGLLHSSLPDEHPHDLQPIVILACHVQWGASRTSVALGTQGPAGDRGGSATLDKQPHNLQMAAGTCHPQRAAAFGSGVILSCPTVQQQSHDLHMAILTPHMLRSVGD